MSKEEIDLIINALEFACQEGYSQDKEWQKRADIIASKLREDKKEPEKPKTTQEYFNECLTRWSRHVKR
jgi:hypothetical protein